MSDLIKREDVIAVIKRCKDRLQGKGLTYEIMLDMVERIPSADRPQGEWIADKHKNIWDMDVDCYRCSNCGSRAINHSLIMDIIGLSYCPNCGARMKGAEDDL